MAQADKPLSVVTGASSGIGFELARLCAEDGFDLIIAADDDDLEDAAEELRTKGARVEAIKADLATDAGVQELVAAVEADGRPVSHLMANAGHGLGHAFLDQDFEDVRHVINTNVVGTILLVHMLAPAMVARGEGRILFTGSVAGYIPGSFQAAYNGTKAFVDSFSFALRNEIKDTGVSITCLMPGATDTNFFERAGMLDTKVGQEKKADPADVAKTGYEAMMKGEASVVHGAMNKAQVAMAKNMPQTAAAEQHRGMAEPGSGKK